MKNKKIILFLMLLVNITISYSQEITCKEHSQEILYGKKVIINKTVTSYTFSHSKVDNYKLSNWKINSDINTPYYIFIKSDNSSGSIRINSKRLREDIFIEFKCIHKVISQDYIEYTFYVNKNEEITYTIPKDGSHHTLSILLLNEDKKGVKYNFTISKYDQL